MHIRGNTIDLYIFFFLQIYHKLYKTLIVVKIIWLIYMIRAKIQISYSISILTAQEICNSYNHFPETALTSVFSCKLYFSLSIHVNKLTFDRFFFQVTQYIGINWNDLCMHWLKFSTSEECIIFQRRYFTTFFLDQLTKLSLSS